MTPVAYSSFQITRVQIETQPNYKHKGRGEYSSSCPNPHCDADKDGFLFWPEKGNYWCRKCGIEGFVVDGQGTELFKVTPEMKARWEAEKRERERAEAAKQMSAIERLQSSKAHERYHLSLNGKGSYIGNKWGISSFGIDHFMVGYCDSCPVYPESSSITIPYFWRGEVINLRHRLVAPSDNTGKYRPEMAGLPSAIFNADLLESEDEIILVEGEFKAIVLFERGYPAIAIPGANNFKEKWLRLFSKVKKTYVVLDPGVEDQARKVGVSLSKIGVETKIVTLPEKPDDLFVKYGMTDRSFEKYLNMGRPV